MLSELHTLNNIFSLLFVALIITIFEIGFFYIILIPRIRGLANDAINEISNNLKNKLNISLNIIIDNILTQIFEKKEILYKTKSDEIKDQIKNEIIKEITKNINFETNTINPDTNKDEINSGAIKNEIINKINSETNKINSDANKINNIIETKKINDIIENFNENNVRKYKPTIETTIYDEITLIIIKVLKNNNIEIDNDLKNYIKMLVVTDFDNKILSILNTLKYDENHIININNDNTIVLSVIIIFVLLILLKLLYNNISLQNYNCGFGPGVKYKVYIASFIIIFNIIFFLLNFYYFGITHKYKGNNELIIHIFDKIKI
jgi:hypothetical protein